MWDIAVDLPRARLDDGAVIEQLIQSFHANHRRIFNVDDPASPIEFLNWTGRLSIGLPQTQMAAPNRARSGVISASTRMAMFDVDAALPTRVLRGDAIEVGEVIDGPAIIEEATTTLVVPPGSRASLSRYGSFVAELSY